MSSSLLTTYFACPCFDIYGDPSVPPLLATADSTSDNLQADQEEEAQPFNPKHPRANFALHPLDHLLFCPDCHELRCPRCYSEEAIAYFCPRCLTERQSYEVKTENNRCPQSCHDCPVCLGALVTSRYLSPDPSSPDSFLLSCPYCTWSTLDIDITFPRSVGIGKQLARLKNGGRKVDPPTSLPGDVTMAHRITPSADAARFFALADFYTTQLEAAQPRRDDARYIAKLLATHGVQALRKPTKPSEPMREALTTSEGLRPYSLDDDSAIISRMASSPSFDNHISTTQHAHQPHTDLVRFPADLRPVPVVLHTKCIKRCGTCRRVLVRPDLPRRTGSGGSSFSTSRFLVRSLAFKHVPRITIKPFDEAAVDVNALAPGVPLYFLATFINPLREQVKVTLATPRITPGRVMSKITILCPQFELDAYKDVPKPGSTQAPSLAMPSAAKMKERYEQQQQQQQQSQPEAGKVWDKTRNRTTVVLEVVPGILPRGARDVGDEEEGIDKGRLDLLEVPVFVRLEHGSGERAIGGEDAMKQEAATAAATAAGSTSNNTGIGGADTTGDQSNRELAYWCVLGLGRIAH